MLHEWRTEGAAKVGGGWCLVSLRWCCVIMWFSLVLFFGGGDDKVEVSENLCIVSNCVVRIVDLYYA